MMEVYSYYVQLVYCGFVYFEQRYKIVSAEVEPVDEDCDWPSDPEDNLSVSELPSICACTAYHHYNLSNNNNYNNNYYYYCYYYTCTIQF